MSGSSDLSDDSIRSPRTIVLCFDGTNGQYDSMNTNVVKFFGLLLKDLPEQQVAYYQAGIGTYFAPGAVSPLWPRLAALLDEAFAWYLDAHVMGGYRYLMDNYRPGDKVCLFGFSRGAYTARALAGMLNKVGLLSRDNLQQVGFAYKAYKRTDKAGVKLAAGFKKTFSREVKVEFVGVWDTVQSTGVLVNRILPFTTSNTSIRVFRHALSLDEHRARFRPNLFHWPTPDDEVLSGEATVQKPKGFKAKAKRLLKRMRPKAQSKNYSTFMKDSKPGKDVCEAVSPVHECVAEEPSLHTDVLEVWFSGCHSDIGGGNVKDGVKMSLAQITLHWMVEQVIQSQCGILFDNDELARIGITAPLPPPELPVFTGQPELDVKDDGCKLVVSESEKTVIHDSVAEGSPSKPNRPTLRPYPEVSDAVAPLYDELQISKLWWIVEVIPSSYTWQDPNGVWHSKWSINLGRGRVIPSKKPKFHHTVKERQDYKPLCYKPKAIYDSHEVYV